LFVIWVVCQTRCSRRVGDSQWINQHLVRESFNIRGQELGVHREHLFTGIGSIFAPPAQRRLLQRCYVEQNRESGVSPHSAGSIDCDQDWPAM
jgi:hypothetical protein